MINMGRTQTSGMDFSWAFRRPTDWGQLHMGVSGTRLLTSRYQLADGETFVNDLNTYSNYSSFVIPKLKTRWYAGLQEANWQGWMTVNHVGRHDGGPVDVIQADTGKAVTLPSHDVSAWWTVDLMLAHQWTSRTRMRFWHREPAQSKSPSRFFLCRQFQLWHQPHAGQCVGAHGQPVADTPVLSAGCWHRSIWGVGLQLDKGRQMGCPAYRTICVLHSRSHHDHHPPRTARPPVD